MHQAALSAAAAAQGQGSCAVLMQPMVVLQWKDTCREQCGAAWYSAWCAGEQWRCEQQGASPCYCGCKRLKHGSSLCFTGRPVEQALAAFAGNLLQTMRIGHTTPALAGSAPSLVTPSSLCGLSSVCACSWTRAEKGPRKKRSVWRALVYTTCTLHCPCTGRRSPLLGGSCRGRLLFCV